MRKELYTAIKTAMEKIEAVKHVDLWNHNVEFIEQEDSWARPAVFVELGPIAWQPYVGGGYRGESSVRLHFVTDDWLEGGQEAAWALIAQIRTAMDGVESDSFHGLRLTETITNHEDILESIEVFSVKIVSHY